MKRVRTIAALLVLGVAGVCDGIGYALLPEDYPR